MSDKPILKENKSDTHLKSFSFVYNKNGFKKRFKLAFILPLLIFLGIMAFPLYIALLSTSIIAINYIFPLLLLPILFAFFTNWLIYQYVLCKRHIEINHQGICWHGFGLNKLPKFCAWEELDQVSLSKIGMFGIRQATLVFSRKDGSDFLFSIENNFWNFIYYPIYIGENCDCTLEEAIAQFAGEIKPISEKKVTEIKYSFFPLAMTNLEQKGKKVVYLAIGIFLLGFITIIIMSFISNRAIALDSSYCSALYWGAGIVVFIVACTYMAFKISIREKIHLISGIILFVTLFYVLNYSIEFKTNLCIWITLLYSMLMRKKWNKQGVNPLLRPFIISIIASFLAGCLLFLLNPLFDNALLWLGNKQQQTFKIIQEDDSEQIWQTTTGREQTFTLRVHTSLRKFKGLGTQKELTTYHLPGVFSAILKNEMEQLSKP